MSADPTPARDARPDTKTRILGAAERLFASRGVAATSLRAVTAEACVNVAAVHYHFGGREGLLRAVLHRRVDPINAERIEQLERLERRHGGAAPVEAILEAFLAPVLETLGRAPELARVASLLFQEPAEQRRELAGELFAELAARFEAALGRALPGLPEDEVRRRFRYVVGAMIHETLGPHAMDPAGPAEDPAGALDALVGFLAAGMRAPAQGPVREAAPEGGSR